MEQLQDYVYLAASMICNSVFEFRSC